VTEWQSIDGRIRLICADCLIAMSLLAENSIDSIVTDPPYGLGFMGKDWDHGIPGVHFWAEALRVAKPGAHLLAFGGTRTFHRLACAIEDAGWEIRDTICWLYGQGFPKSSRVNRDPGFCQCAALEHNDGNTGHGLPQADHTDMAEPSGDDGLRRQDVRHLSRKSEGCRGDCLPGCDSDDVRAPSPSVVAPASSPRQADVPTHNHSLAPSDDLAAARAHNLSQARCTVPPSSPGSHRHGNRETDIHGHTEQSNKHAGTSESNCHRQDTDRGLSSEPPFYANYRRGFPLCQGCGKPIVDGFGTALKPAFEPIIIARKPLDGTVAQNVQKWGTGAINVDGCRIGIADGHGGGSKGSSGFCGDHYEHDGFAPSPTGRFPANVIHDGSDEVLAEFPKSVDGVAVKRNRRGKLFKPSSVGFIGKYADDAKDIGYGGGGSAARFFYCAKAARNERWFYCSDCAAAYPPQERSSHLHGHYQPDGKEDWRHIIGHPTQKPESLMRYLCRLVTPPGGMVLDPFMGSGSTGKAAIIEGFRFIGIELDPVYGEIARARIERELTQGVLPFQAKERTT